MVHECAKVKKPLKVGRTFKPSLHHCSVHNSSSTTCQEQSCGCLLQICCGRFSGSTGAFWFRNENLDSIWFDLYKWI